MHFTVALLSLPLVLPLVLAAPLASSDGPAKRWDRADHTRSPYLQMYTMRSRLQDKTEAGVNKYGQWWDDDFWLYDAKTDGWAKYLKSSDGRTHRPDDVAMAVVCNQAGLDEAGRVKCLASMWMEVRDASTD